MRLSPWITSCIMWGCRCQRGPLNFWRGHFLLGIRPNFFDRSVSTYFSNYVPNVALILKKCKIRLKWGFTVISVTICTFICSLNRLFNYMSHFFTDSLVENQEMDKVTFFYFVVSSQCKTQKRLLCCTVLPDINS